jgi:hypothetical protein
MVEEEEGEKEEVEKEENEVEGLRRSRAWRLSELIAEADGCARCEEEYKGKVY